MPNHRLIVAALFPVGLAVVLGSVAAAGALAGESGRTASTRAQLRAVNFVGHCSPSHRGADDPIVFPGRPGASHDHTFVGNVTTSAFSTLSSLRAGESTYHRPGETAAYWMPTLFADGSPVLPRSATIYYRRRTMEPVSPFPPGFRLVAGNSRATSPQDLQIAAWTCGPRSEVEPSSAPPACPPGRRTTLRLRVSFPSCWDGAGRENGDQTANMAYPAGGRCPASHPVELPAVTLIFRYPPVEAASLRLASGSVYSGHADFFNAWDQGTLTRLVDRCLNALRHCGSGS